MKFESPLAAFLYWESERSDEVYLRQPLNGTMVEYTFRQAGEEARKAASYLRSLDLPEKSHVGLISKNCAHWIMSDLAIMMAGYISIPLYPTINADTIAQILEHSEAKAIFVGKLDDFASQKAGIPDIPVISMKAYGMEEGTSWESIMDDFDPLKEMPVQHPDDLMSIIYTSGTTGHPKGVMHSVAAFTLVTNTSLDVLPLPPNPRFFSYLPLSHIAERIIAEMGSIFRGGVVTFPESLETFASDLAAVQPHIFFGVPRIYAKFQEGVLKKMSPKKLKRMISLPIIGGIVKKKITEKLGLAEAQLIYSGAAPLASSVINWYAKLGITVMQGYGMTEDCILSHYNLPGANRVGTVGRVVPPAKARLSGEGEICIKSDCLTLGYYKEPEMTKELFDQDGYLKTGDIGEYDHEGYLTITGRVKDQFKTDKGKYICQKMKILN
jgi:long-chain acyl-CoA synthetase